MVEYRAETFGTVMSAASDATRRAILAQLTDGPMRVGDIAGCYPMSLNAVSKHLKVLEQAGLVRRTRRGREHVLSLNAAPLQDIANWALSYQRFWDAKLDRLAAFFAARRQPP